MRPAPAPDRERPIAASDQSMKNVPAPDVFEDRAVNREEHDVGRGDVERHAEDALERHVERADRADRCRSRGARAIARPMRSKQGPVERVDEEAGGGDRQDPADRAAGRLEHEENRGRAEDDVDRRRIGGAIDERLEVERSATRARPRRAAISTQSSARTRAQVAAAARETAGKSATSAISRKLTR